MNLDELLKLRWEPGGRGPTGVDCVGMVLAYAKAAGFDLPEVQTTSHREEVAAPLRALCQPISRGLQQHENWVLFFELNGTPIHVGVVLPGGQILHCCFGGSRCDNDLRLMERVGMRLIGGIPLTDGSRAAHALREQGLAHPGVLVWLAIAVLSSVVSYALAPKAPRFGSASGRYGYDSLITQNRGDVILPDLLGTVTLAGNSPFTEPMDKFQEVTDASLQKACKVVVFGLGPMESLGLDTFEFRINGLSFDVPYWYASGGVYGIYQEPVQVKSEAIDGSIDGSTHQPSVTCYKGTPALEVPVDVRAQYVRDFPIYGFNGTAYCVFRLVDSGKYASFNLLARIKGRKLRTYDSSGWVRASATITIASTGATKYLLSVSDIDTITSVIHNGATHYDQMDAGHQSGSVCVINRTKGILEFPSTVPSATGNIVVILTYFVRAVSTNPATHILSILAEPGRGRALPETKIDWAGFVAARDYYNESVSTTTDYGATTSARYTTNYVLDQRRPITEHIRELLNACRSILISAAGKVKLKPLKADDTSVFAFNTTNIIDGSFTCQQLDQTARSNQIRIQYHDAAAFNAESTIGITDYGDQVSRSAYGNEGIRSEALKYPAVDSAAQARRLAEEVISTELDIAWSVAFTCAIGGLALEPGDIISITHPAQPRWSAKLFRIDDCPLDENDRIQVKASEFLSA